jgi:glycosyltransferase involved in cell wall biosynthesis
VHAPRLKLQPLAVSVDPSLSGSTEIQIPGAVKHQQTRKRWGLPQQAVLFVFSFDLNSTIQRKNPLGVINAFQKAFPAGDPLAEQVALVIKTHRASAPDHRWQLIHRLAQADPHLHLLETTLPRPELMALYAACDVFVSLHRAEGFGRNIAEALLLGLDVIATDHGGNVDFCLPPLAHLAESYPLALRSGDYPHHEGQCWGQPSEKEAAKLMRQIAERRFAVRAAQHVDANLNRNPAVLAAYQEQFSVAAAGARYRDRLEELWGQRQEFAGRLRWGEKAVSTNPLNNVD